LETVKRLQREADLLQYIAIIFSGVAINLMFLIGTLAQSIPAMKSRAILLSSDLLISAVVYFVVGVVCSATSLYIHPKRLA